MSWQAMTTTKKGNIGEPHTVDFFAQYKGKKLFAVEVKTYPRRALYDQTGIDAADYDTYLHMLKEQDIDTVVVWVDEFEQMIYQNRISILQRFAQPKDGKVYFGLGAMRKVRRLNAEEVRAIRARSTTDYKMYENVKRFFR